MNFDLRRVEAALAQDSAAAIAQWELPFRAQLESAADQILSRRSHSPVVLLSGPSGSAKTTTGLRLRELLTQRGTVAHLLSMDNYFISVSDPAFPRRPDGAPDLESPFCLDFSLLSRHFDLLEAGQSISVPIFDFPTSRRLADKSIPLDASSGDIFIFEGIHALHPLISGRHPEAFRLYASPTGSFSLDGTVVCDPILLRLLRRLIRDYLSRGASAEFTLSLWDEVLAGEAAHILPHRPLAHFVIDTTLGYELQALKPLGMSLLATLSPSVPCREFVDRGLAALSQVSALPGASVPPDSILREFIGA